MEEDKKKSSNMVLKIVVILIVAVVVTVGVYFGAQFIFNNVMLKGETITAENYEELMKKVGEKLDGQDDLYHLTYGMMYHMVKDGLAASLTNSEDESAMYANIYGKTVQQLIDEGKQLMEENNVTIEQMKEQLKNSNTVLDSTIMQ